MRDFFSAIDAIAPAIRRTAHAAEQLLLDERTGYVLISNFDAARSRKAASSGETWPPPATTCARWWSNRAWPDWTPADAA